jgi:CheY-like chemotaxis protein
MSEWVGAAAIQELGPPEMSKSNSSIRAYEILVVEDNDNDVELFLRSLRKVEMELDVAVKPFAVSNGAQAAAQLRDRRYDAIFLDINMPPPDGVELTKQIRNSKLNRTTLVVIITGAGDNGLMSRAFQAGANLFLFKPIDRTRLLRTLRVSNTQMDRERRRLQRVKVQCKISVEYEHGRLDGETLDVSMGGMFVRANRILPVGSAVNVALALPLAAEPIRAPARVVRVVGNEFMGIQLEAIGKAESERLGGFLVPLIVAVTEGDR